MSEESLYKNIHQDLIDRCRLGESKAQFEIYRLYYKAMYNTSFRIIGDEQEAEDIMQESFFKAFDKISTYRNEVSFGAWLRRIVVNTSIDALKKRRLSFMPIEEAYGIKSETLEESDYTVETVEQLKDAIEKLPEGYKLVLNLHLIEEYDHNEIASMLGITASTSRSQLARAKQRLIEIIKNNPKAK
jgi:RNA polymerase sigma factor (sigma-70 family)